jgi:hypothetical protein
MVILLMLVLGSGGGYIYFKISTPAVHSNTGAGSSSTPSTTPAASPAGTGTPSSFAPNHSVAFTLLDGPRHTIVATG